MFMVQCPGCNAVGFTESSGPGELDDAVRCVSPAGSPAGSVDGSCSTAGHTHEEHVAHVIEHGDASNRPVVIIVVPGTTQMRVMG